MQHACDRPCILVSAPRQALHRSGRLAGVRGGMGVRLRGLVNAGSTRWPCRFTQHLWLKGLVMRDQPGGPCAGADRGRRQNGSEGAVLTGLPQVSPRPGWSVAGGQGGALRFEAHGDVGQVQKRYNIVLGPTQLNTIQQSLWQDLAKPLQHLYMSCTLWTPASNDSLKPLPPKGLNTSLNPP